MTSARPPAIALTCLELCVEGAPPRFGQNQSYIHAVLGAGGAPLLLPQVTDLRLLRSYYDRCDGLLLPGGEDVDPARYGEPVHEKCGRFSPGRDEMELLLARWAVDDGKPLLAICRGIQVLNVACGGSLFQDIATQAPGAQKHDWFPGYERDRLAHTVRIEPHTRLAGLMGSGSLPVNSLHHQAISRVAPGLTVTARAPDGIAEAAEMAGHPFALAVQWHPEELAPADGRAQSLFNALVEACRA